MQGTVYVKRVSIRRHADKESHRYTGKGHDEIRKKKKKQAQEEAGSK